MFGEYFFCLFCGFFAKQTTQLRCSSHSLNGLFLDTFWFDCTVESECSLDPIKRLTYECSGIISATDCILTDVMDAGLSQLTKLFTKTKDIRDACMAIWNVHLLYCAAENDNGKENDKVWYPIDKLRGSIKYAVSKDVDFSASSNTLTNRKCKQGLVVLEFEYSKDVYGSDTTNCLSSNKAKLLKEYKNKAATPSHELKPCHYSSKYLKWFNKETQNVDYYAAPYQLYYESYVIIKNIGNSLRYDERFNGYGFNTIVHIEPLAVADQHNFNVSNNGFIIHYIQNQNISF